MAGAATAAVGSVSVGAGAGAGAGAGGAVGLVAGGRGGRRSAPPARTGWLTQCGWCRCFGDGGTSDWMWRYCARANVCSREAANTATVRSVTVFAIFGFIVTLLFGRSLLAVVQSTLGILMSLEAYFAAARGNRAMLRAYGALAPPGGARTRDRASRLLRVGPTGSRRPSTLHLHARRSASPLRARSIAHRCAAMFMLANAGVSVAVGILVFTGVDLGCAGVPNYATCVSVPLCAVPYVCAGNRNSNACSRIAFPLRRVI